MTTQEIIRRDLAQLNIIYPNGIHFPMIRTWFYAPHSGGVPVMTVHFNDDKLPMPPLRADLDPHWELRGEDPLETAIREGADLPGPDDFGL